MSEWTILYDQETEAKTFEEYGLGPPSRTRGNQIIDNVTFDQVVQDSLAAAQFALGKYLTIFKDDARWFHGRLKAPKPRGSARGEAFSFTVEGPWRFLQKLQFKHVWKIRSDPFDKDSALIDQSSGRLFLGATKDGAYLNTAQQIAEIVNYAIGQGAPLLFDDTELPTLNMPLFEVRNAHCSEAITKILQLTPDAIAWFDYSTAPFPTLRIKRRYKFNEAGELTGSDLRAVAIDASDEDLIEPSIEPRDDLLIDGAVIEYEQINHENNQETRIPYKDKFPLDHNEDSPDGFYANVNLEGQNINYSTGRLTCELINHTSAAWWKDKRRKPELARDSVADLVISPVTRGGPGITIYPNEITVGVYADWMGGNMAQETVEAFASYSIKDTAGNVRKKIKNEPIHVTINTTDLVSGSYRSSISGTFAEPVPVGVAKYIFQALGNLQYDGRLTLIDDECNERVTMGDMINITGGLAEYAGMNAVVQSITENAENGETQVSFGPPKSLEVETIMDILRVWRTRTRTTPFGARSTGLGGSGASLDIGKDGSASSPGTGKGAWIRQDWYNPDSLDGPSVSINIEDLQALADELNITDAQFSTQYGPVKMRLFKTSIMPDGSDTCVNGKILILSGPFKAD